MSQYKEIVENGLWKQIPVRYSCLAYVRRWP